VTDHFNEIRDGDDVPISMTVFQAERVAAQLRGVADGTADRSDAELAARLLQSLALDARPDMRESFAYSAAIDSHRTWEAIAFLPLPAPPEDPGFTSTTPIYVVTGRPRFRSHDLQVVVCTAIDAGTWPPTSSAGVHVAFRQCIDDTPVHAGTVITIPGSIVTNTISLYAGFGPVGEPPLRSQEVDVLHNLEQTVRVID